MESRQNIGKENNAHDKELMRIGIAAEHGGFELKVQLVKTFLDADFKAEERFARRLAKVAALEKDDLHKP
jgi:ribose 5-phosphate isomerase RpiB